MARCGNARCRRSRAPDSSGTQADRGGMENVSRDQNFGPRRERVLILTLLYEVVITSAMLTPEARADSCAAPFPPAMKQDATCL